jgi:TolA-binding protein
MRDAFALLGTLGRRSDEILAQLQELSRRITNMSGTLADLQAQVTQNTSVIESAKTLIQGLAQKLANAGTDPAALDALRTELATSDAALAAAVAANTPAAPVPPTPVPTPPTVPSAA